MSEVEISVLSDPEATSSGEAIIRIVGVALLPPGSTFRIEPVNGTGSSDPPEGWPSGELKPRSTRITRDGVDIVVGTDVVKSPALQPGTPVVVSVPAVSARTELRWPSFEAAETQPGSALGADRDRHTGQAKPESTGKPEGAEKPESNEEAEGRAWLLQKAEALLTERSSSAETEERIRLIAEAAAQAAAAPPAATPAPGAPARRAPAPAPAASAPAGIAIEPLARLRPVVRSGAADGDFLAPPMPPKPAPLRRTPQLQAPVPPAPVKPSPRKSLPTPPPESGHVRMATLADDAGRRPADLVGPFLAGMLLAGSLAGGLWWAQGRPAEPQAVAPVPLRLTVESAASAAPPDWLVDILDVPARSPSGQSAEGLDLAEALQRADANLHGPATRQSRQDAKFWLRRALTLGLGDERLLWAMTQLGTLYANPDGDSPDYGAARALWELAAGKGDRVAQCFLASLLERGLGGPPDRARALELYERARGSAGCRGADEAIARLKKAAP